MPDDDELKRRNEQLAQEILEELKRRGPNPERDAYDAEKEQRDREALEEYYRRTGQKKDTQARARSATEMTFAASLDPCPSCKTMEPPKLELYGAGTSWAVRGSCPRCETKREYGWETEGNPNQATVLPRQLGDERPSAIIPVGKLIGELDRILPFVREQPEALKPIEWRASLAAIDRAITCLYELQKFVPQGMQIIPDTKLTDAERKDRSARRERFQRAWMQNELDRLLTLAKRYATDAPRVWKLEEPAQPTPAKGAIDRESLNAHEQWVRAGRKGPGRLDVVGYDARGLRYGGVLFEGARLERVNFGRALLDAARMADVELVDVNADDAICTSLKLTRAKLAGGSFVRANLDLAVFDEAAIDETTFDDAHLDRSQWIGARVTAASFDRAVFGNTRFDGGRFTGCTFRKADLRLLTSGIKCTTANAVFEDCDLRFTRWDGRDVSGATFIRCKLHGISGAPVGVDSVHVEDPDLSVDGNGSDIGDVEDVIALWK
jgi:uncharacterized protein YjbI with pentapeptide repeats